MTDQVQEKQLTTADVVAATDKDNQVNTNQQQMAQDNGHPAALLANDESSRLRSRWSEIQADFVDEPRRSVEEADALVAELMKRLAQVFADERANLEGQWGRGDNVSTEDLRVALRRYRSFFDRLLSV